MCPHNLQEPPASWQPEEEAGSLSQAPNPTQTYMYLLGQDTLAAKAEEDQKAPENPDEAGLDTIIKGSPNPTFVSDRSSRKWCSKTKHRRQGRYLTLELAANRTKA